MVLNLVGDADDTAGRTGASVSSLEGLLVVALAEVVGAAVRNDGTADDALGTNELDELVLDRALGVAVGVGLDVAKVTNVTGLVAAIAVGLAVRVEVRTSGGAAVSVVTKGVNVEATLGVGVVALDVPRDSGGLGLGGLLEGDSASDLGVTTENSN